MLIDKQADRTFLLPSSTLGKTIHLEINRNFCKLLGYIKQLKELDKVCTNFARKKKRRS